MSLSFLDGAGKFAGLHQLIEELQKFVENQPLAYKYIARVFSASRKNPAAEHEQVKVLIKVTIEHPLSELSAEEQRKLVSILEKVYACPESDFQRVRSDFLEFVLFRWSRFFIPGLATAKLHMEPTVRDGGNNISQYDKHCDFVWHWRDDVPLVFCECKANIYNTINVGKSLQKQGEGKEKILYMHECHDYLQKCYAVPRMMLAFYNEEYEDVEETLESWGMPYFEFLGPREIISQVASVQP
ncbi:hypothetical protein [Selenomonas sp. AB3002]|uniref:hypothetical protein n=1 Tax=Selenomonas sp. AB3002 TaxID=1392502 RepID=UPI0004962A36